MFGIVKRRSRPLLCLLALAQLLLSAPMVSAVAGPAGDSVAAMPCAGDMPMDDSGECPCCPDGITNIATCLSACTASVATPVTIGLPGVASQSIAPADVAARLSGGVDDPPLKPPPIR
jgi:hypothetical protein